MRIAAWFVSKPAFLPVVVLLVAWLSTYPIPAAAQQGQNAVYQAPKLIVPSPAFIDASMFASQGGTICSVIYNILKLSGYSAAVIDARGLPNSTPATSMTCAAGWTPWNNGTTFLNKPSTILLPSTTGANPIVIPTTWVLPSKTRLVGAGEAITAAGFTPGTTLQAQTSFSGTAMIAFGQSSCSPCTAISVERLNLNGTGQSIDGIDNAFAQNNSYVDHVGLFRIRGTGLSISGNASNSGPYSNITFDLGGTTGTSSTVCASINGVSGTKGIHGLSCTSESNDPPAAVLLDSSNNSIKDVRIVGFYDGILVGANQLAASNVLVNIIGDTSNVCYPTWRVARTTAFGCPIPNVVLFDVRVGDVKSRVRREVATIPPHRLIQHRRGLVHPLPPVS